MTGPLWVVMAIQIAMGAFDTLYHHEFTERLAWRPSQAGELRLHGLRNLIYAILFFLLAWSEPHGAWAASVTGLVLVELLITLWDFVEEDRTRKLSASERVTHTLLALNYGVILALLVPLLVHWAQQPSQILPAWYGVTSWFFTIVAWGVALAGLRDFLAARRCRRLQTSDLAGLADALADRRSVLVTGGTGFIGSRLVAALVAAGHEVTVLTRRRANAADLPAPLRIVTNLGQIPADARIDAIVNLAGDPIASGIWTRAKRMRIIRSRLAATRDVLRLVRRLNRRPEVLVSGSAIGWYGLRGDQILTETNLGTGCFSRRVCVAWERWGRKAQKYGVRTILLRAGLVLDSGGGILARMLIPFELGVGGRFGDGRQWMSWIHRDDMVRLIVHAIASPTLTGPVNATAPEPVTNRGFTAALAGALHRPAIFPVPSWPLRLALGDFADELLLGGQRVLPGAALRSGFRFLYPDIDSALAAAVGSKQSAGGDIPAGFQRLPAKVPSHEK